MGIWKYIIRDNQTGKVLLSESGFETPEDAAEQARMEVNVENLKNVFIETEPT